MIPLGSLVTLQVEGQRVTGIIWGRARTCPVLYDVRLPCGCVATATEGALERVGEHVRKPGMAGPRLVKA